MGQTFAQLTNPNTALIDRTTQQPTFVGSPSQVLARANAGLPSAEAMLGPDVLNPSDTSQAAKSLPFIGRPAMQQAAQAGAAPGMVNALSPALSKGGKLLAFL